METGGDAGSQQVNYKYSKDIIPIIGYVLAAVGYADTPAPGQTAVASYTYGHSYQGDQPGVGPQTIFPILKRADDPHFAGAMTKIFYNYYGSECRPPNFASLIRPQWATLIGFGLARKPSRRSEATARQGGRFPVCGSVS